ncbi:hypothetical protein [Mucilaginibacter sp.]|uniref:hypothetical protein n=1 Tax=Mucilaginibacter sp. TaxID=1882438 RepID=UPI002637EA93|nr:hypothetical protein [Mucilaginibacter sp.]MDB4923837.1 hypothetical protein [Mucilaginibacter sp.]
MDEELKRKAYLEGMKLRKAGLDNEVIYARLEKQGIPDELIKNVLQNMSIQKKIDVTEEQKPSYYSGLLKAGLGFLLATIVYFIYPGVIIIPIGLIISGIAYAIISKGKIR